jgi:hypothetical protein
MNTTTTPDQSPESELREIGQRIETYRADLSMPKATLLRQYPELGTDKTFGLIVKPGSDLSELKIEERWLHAYRSVWHQIEGAEDAQMPGLIADLQGPVELCRAFLETRTELGNRRFILLLGDSGVGKSSAIQALKSKPYGGNVVTVEACSIWRNDKTTKGTDMPLLRAIGKALGLRDLPRGRDTLLEVVIAKLQGVRRCLCIDEAHHLCPDGFNAIKALINMTPVIVVATAIPHLWDKLSGSRAAWAECKQLTGNRLKELIHLRLQKQDVVRVLETNLTDLAAALAPKDMERAAAAILTEAVHLGNLSFVEAVVRRYRREIKAGQDHSFETLLNATAATKKQRR